MKFKFILLFFIAFEFMKEKIKDISQIYPHFLFWIFYYGIEFSIEVYANIYTKTSIIRYLLGIAVFYIFLNIFRREGLYLKIYLFILSFLVFQLASLFIKYGTFNLFQSFTEPPISVQILYVIDNFVHLFFIAFIYNTYKNLIEKHQKAMEIETQLFEIETNYLNSKIDVHFFMNSINLFYSQFLIKESKAAEKLLILSDFVKKNL